MSMTTAENTPPTEYQRLFDLDQQIAGCLYPTFSCMREEEPVVWVDKMEAYAVTRHKDVSNVLKHPELFSSAQATGPVLTRQTQEVIGRERMPDFKRWSDGFMAAIGNDNLSQAELRRMLVSNAEFFTYFAEQVADRKREPRGDMVSEVANARLPDGDELSLQEILGMLNQFLIAGNETTAKLLIFFLYRLAGDPVMGGRLRPTRMSSRRSWRGCSDSRRRFRACSAPPTRTARSGGVPIPGRLRALASLRLGQPRPGGLRVPRAAGPRAQLFPTAPGVPFHRALLLGRHLGPGGGMGGHRDSAAAATGYPPARAKQLGVRAQLRPARAARAVAASRDGMTARPALSGRRGRPLRSGDPRSLSPTAECVPAPCLCGRKRLEVTW